MIPLRDKIEFCYLHGKELEKLPPFEKWNFRLKELTEIQRETARKLCKMARRDLGYSEKTSDVDIIWLLFRIRRKIL